MRAPIGFCFAVGIALAATPSGALLLEIDLNTPGDGLVTRDTDTGLDWLDVTATLGVSYDDIVGGAGGWVASGWRHATAQEICEFGVANVFFTTGCGGSLSIPDEGMLSVLELFGSIEVAPGDIRTQGAYAETPNGFGAFFGVSCGPCAVPGASLFQSWGAGSLNAVFPAEPIAPDLSHPAFGNFLVREVPEPSAGALIGIGLLGLAVRGRD